MNALSISLDSLVECLNRTLQRVLQEKPLLAAARSTDVQQQLFSCIAVAFPHALEGCKIRFCNTEGRVMAKSKLPWHTHEDKILCLDRPSMNIVATPLGEHIAWRLQSMESAGTKMEKSSNGGVKFSVIELDQLFPAAEADEMMLKFFREEKTRWEAKTLLQKTPRAPGVVSPGRL